MMAIRAAMVLLLAAASSQAQVYKCTEGGKPVFTDKPCTGASGGQPLAGPGQLRATPAAGSTPGGPATGPEPDSGVDFQVLTRRYKVQGADLRQVQAWVRANRAGEAWANARWNVQWEFFLRPLGAGQCSVAGVRIRVTGDVLLPEWVQEPQASLADKAAWGRWLDLLARHEDGHVNNGREFGVLLKERVLGAGAGECNELAARVRREYDLLYANLQDRDREYDRRTDHGLRQDNPR